MHDTDPKPYTPEEWAKLDKYLWECLEDEDRARLIATVQALAAAQARVKELEIELEDLRLDPGPGPWNTEEG